MPCAVEIAQQGDLCPVVQQFLINPPDSLDEGIVWSLPSG
jgi:hypothetical protein